MIYLGHGHCSENDESHEISRLVIVPAEINSNVLQEKTKHYTGIFTMNDIFL